MLRAVGYTALIALLGGVAALYRHAPEIAAGAVLYPARTTTLPVIPPNCVERRYPGDGLQLQGWACAAQGARRGTIVYLHGIADNRGSAVGTILRYTPMGYDVVAYDSRAHGQSEGEACTYGYFEKSDLRRVVNSLPDGPVVALGTSLGAAVALQAAPLTPRLSGIVAVEVFADLNTVVRDRAPFFVWEGLLSEAFAVAERRADFRVAETSPQAAARNVHVPVLLIHGANDTDTRLAHSQRVFDALVGQKRLVMVPGAGHNQSLRGASTWSEIDRWIEYVVRGES
jgi:pimeloyl-ACP methyl ester carboxylesterase